jgi:hypothetical protein
MNREAFPSRRGADAIAFDYEGRIWTATLGCFEDGRVAEPFIDAPKESPRAGTALKAAILASLALQGGVSLANIRHALGGRDKSPIGAALALLMPEGEADD